MPQTASLASTSHATTDRRRRARAVLGRAGTLRTADGAVAQVIVADLTRDGCRLHTDLLLAPHADVQVGLAHIGLTRGRIVWRGSQGYGCRFDQPLSPGAITAAAGGTNVSSFPGAGPIVAEPPQNEVKLAPWVALALLAGAVLASWGGVAAVAVLLLR